MLVRGQTPKIGEAEGEGLLLTPTTQFLLSVLFTGPFYFPTLPVFACTATEALFVFFKFIYLFF